MTTLWVMLHVAAQRDYELHSLDFITAFSQGSLHEEICLRRPPGFTGSFPPSTQWSLRRPVYGLRQAPREWHDTLRTTLAALGFAPSTADPSLFLRTDTSLLPFYVLVYVDDLVFATADTEALALVKSELQKRHTCTDLGELRSYLGLHITRDRTPRSITLSQSHMVHQVLQRFGFQYSSQQLTPLSTSLSLSAPPSDESVEPSGPYPDYARPALSNISVAALTTAAVAALTTSAVAALPKAAVGGPTLCDSKDGVSLFDHTAGVAVAPAADADSTVHSHWTTRDAAARLAVRSHLPSAERAHFSQYKTARTLYDAVVARYSSPATAALSRLMLPYLFPDLAAFATVADLITHLRSDTRYRAALPAEFCTANAHQVTLT
ncbi:unnamed protein product [Closterium sp. NIES-54]